MLLSVKDIYTSVTTMGNTVKARVKIGDASVRAYLRRSPYVEVNYTHARSLSSVCGPVFYNDFQTSVFTRATRSIARYILRQRGWLAG